MSSKMIGYTKSSYKDNTFLYALFSSYTYQSKILKLFLDK